MTSAIKSLRYGLFLVKQRLLLSETDVVIAAYPKTGSTWLQLMIRILLVDHFNLPPAAIKEVFVENLRATWRWPQDLPRIYITHGMPWFNEESHHSMTVHNRKFRRHKVLLLAREPKDTLVSLYFQNRYRSIPAAYKGDIESMVHDDIYGIWKYIKYYQAWYRETDAPKDLFLVRYEDLRADPERQLEAICGFLGLDGVSRHTIERAVAFCCFEKMQQAEMGDSTLLPGLNRSKNLRREAFKVREGRVGGYKEHFTDATIRYLDACVREHLPPQYGYPLTTAVDVVAGRESFSARASD